MKDFSANFHNLEARSLFFKYPGGMLKLGIPVLWENIDILKDIKDKFFRENLLAYALIQVCFRLYGNLK